MNGSVVLSWMHDVCVCFKAQKKNKFPEEKEIFPDDVVSVNSYA